MVFEPDPDEPIGACMTVPMGAPLDDFMTERWILASGFWDDTGVWIDTSTWID